jgi:DNA-directed RNA polymerase alpha subunit
MSLEHANLDAGAREPFHKTEVATLEISYRCAHALYNSGYTTIAQIKAARDAELLSVRNFGKVSLREVRAVLG